MKTSENISYRQNLAFENIEKGCFCDFQNVDNQYRYSFKIFSTFTGKELDVETGYSYFGARYLDHTLTTAWLSVDPMADKYPSISPYAYCAWNPVKLVDPEGMDVYIIGDAAEQATSQLSSRGIKITRNGKTGKLTYTLTGKRLSDNDKRLINAINSENIIVNINATNAPFVPYEDISLTNNIRTGQFLGVNVSDGDNRIAVSSQLVNPNKCAIRDNEYNVPLGTSLLHELTESFEAGRICLEKGESCGPCWEKRNGVDIDCPADHVYYKAHQNATLQARDAAPIVKSRRDEVNFRIANIMTGISRSEWNRLPPVFKQYLPEL